MTSGWSNEYLREIAKRREAGGETELTYRTPIENMLNAASQELAKDRQLTIQHEPERQSGSSPDFRITDDGETVIGYIECKKPGASLEAALKSDQLKRYGQLSPNILLTDGWRWCRLRDGKIVEDIQLRKPLSPGARADFHQLLQTFLQHKGAPIATAQKLAEALAIRCIHLREGIENIISQDKGELQNLYKELSRQIYRDMKHKEFADAIAQTTVYSLLMARLHAADPKLNLYTVTQYIPRTFSLIRHLSKFLQELDSPAYANIRWCVDDILAVINNMNAEEIAATLSVPQKAGITDTDDPFLYFYETFLAAYDEKNRKIRGVYYTPLPVVRFIIRAIDSILTHDFNLPQGVAGEKVISLDFAAGSGTFMLELMRQAIDKESGNRKPLIKERLLPNTHGFEYLIAAYAIAHLKLSYFLKNHGLDIIAESDEKQLQLYLTNTLGKIKIERELGFISPLAKETELANQIKEEQTILVIMGNPPYSGHSQNKEEWISKEIDAYKSVDGKKMTEEKTLKWLQDDYVKFIRFAQLKMDQMERGIVAIITNHAFLDSPTFRGMRQSLMKTFNRLYFLDLHGNSKRKEKAPDGGKDENVFDIQQGVAISLLVKNPAVKNGVFHYDLYGKRKDKYEFCAAENIESVPWAPIKPKSPWYLFVPYDYKAAKKYEQYPSLKDIFGKFTSGITTSRDHFTIGFTRDEIRERVHHFVKLSPEEAREFYHLGEDGRDWKVRYAQDDLLKPKLDDEKFCPVASLPFDIRHTYYTGKSRGFHSYPRGSVMRHMRMENLGLCVSKQQETPGEWQHAFVSDTIALLHCATAKEVSYIFPLHLHNSEKEENITPTFREWINDHYGKKPSPEEILGYIYATLHSPEYRRRYADFLRRDFPRIPFPEDIAEFRHRAEIGNQLITAHLLRNITSNINLHGDDQTIDKIRHDGSTRLYINKTSYLSEVPLEAYNHPIGGYHPLDKYLKSRKGRQLTLQDIETIGKAVTAILQTQTLTKSL